MAKHQRLIIVLAIVAVVIAVVSVIAIFVSGNTRPPEPTVAPSAIPSDSPVPSAIPNAIQNEATIRAQIYAEMTSTAIMLAVTNQSATLVSMQASLDARDRITPSPQAPAEAMVVTPVTQQQAVTMPTSQTQAIAVVPLPPTTAPQVLQSAVVTDPMQVQLGICAQQSTREGRLDCASQYYFQLSQGLPGIQGYMRSLGATWKKLDIMLPFQPDSTQLGSGGVRLWGARVQTDTLTVSGNSCLVTDVPSRLGQYGWRFMDTRLNPPVYHVGNGSTAPNQTVDIAFNGDCSDWPEIVAAMGNSSPISQQSQSLACMNLSDLKQLGRVIQELSNNGELAGAQLAFNQNWTAPTGWVIQKNGQNVTSVNAGDVASAWSPEACRPLAR